MDWYSLSAHSENLRDKFVMLAVCYGHCADALSALTQDHSWALSVMATQESLSNVEAMAFFPTFLQTLSGLCLEGIDPVQIQLALDTHNALSGNKMKLFSDALPR
jgi:hypothetical protein